MCRRCFAHVCSPPIHQTTYFRNVTCYDTSCCACHVGEAIYIYGTGLPYKRILPNPAHQKANCSASTDTRAIFHDSQLGSGHASSHLIPFDCSGNNIVNAIFLSFPWPLQLQPSHREHKQSKKRIETQKKVQMQTQLMMRPGVEPVNPSLDFQCTTLGIPRDLITPSKTLGFMYTQNSIHLKALSLKDWKHVTQLLWTAISCCTCQTGRAKETSSGDLFSWGWIWHDIALEIQLHWQPDPWQSPNHCREETIRNWLPRSAGKTPAEVDSPKCAGTKPMRKWTPNEGMSQRQGKHDYKSFFLIFNTFLIDAETAVPLLQNPHPLISWTLSLSWTLTPNLMRLQLHLDYTADIQKPAATFQILPKTSRCPTQFARSRTEQVTIKSEAYTLSYTLFNSPYH